MSIDLIQTIREKGVLYWWDEVNFVITKVYVAANTTLKF